MNAGRYPIRKIDREKAAPSGEVKVTFDPSVFNWHDSPGLVRRGGIFISVTKNEIIISSAAARKIIAAAKPDQDGSFHAVIGVAPKAIAIRLAQGGEHGYRMRQDNKSRALRISCRSLIADLGWDIPIRLPAMWDVENEMLVGRFPDVDKHAKAESKRAP